MLFKLEKYMQKMVALVGDKTTTGGVILDGIKVLVRL